MTFEDPALRLTRILENVGRIQAHVQGYDQQAYLRNTKTKDAVERCLDRISEAVLRLGDYLDDRHPDVDWQELRDLAPLLRLDDEAATDALAWKIVVTDLATVEEACRADLKRLSEGARQ